MPWYLLINLPVCLPVPAAQVLDVSELGLPAALPSLPRLQRCYLDKLIFEALPPGPWLHSLRWLGAPLGALIHSVATLRAAPALEYVCAESRGNEAEIWGSPAAAGLFNWLARHPPLRRVCFNALATQTAYNSLKFTAHVSQLARDRPALLVHCADSDGEALGTGSFMWLLDVE